MAGLGAAGLLLVNLHALAQLSNDTSTFSGQVAASCSINNLQSEYSLPINNGFLYSGYQPFEAVSNSQIRMTAKYETLQEPSGFNPQYRRLIFRQVVNGDPLVGKYVDVSGQETPSQTFNDSPGTATAQLLLVVGKSLQPGSYSYRVTISCLLS